MSLGIDSVALSLLYIIYLCVFIGRISRINANTMHVRFFSTVQFIPDAR